MRDEIEGQAPAALQPKLKPANENPWYVLMTLYGEQDGVGTDYPFHEQNRKAWNAWAGQAMDAELRSAAAYSAIIDVVELESWDLLNEEIEQGFVAEFKRRNPETDLAPPLPDPADLLDFSDTEFRVPLSVAQMVFPQEVFWGGSDFLHFSDFMRTVFLGRVGFCSVLFKQEAYFRGSKFVNEVDFDATIFENPAYFDDVAMFGKAHFKSVKFLSFAYFKKAEFGVPGTLGQSSVLFSDCQFGKPISFHEAVFHDVYPDFSGAELHEKTTFTRNSGGKIFWPETTTQKAEQAKASCATIRHILAKQGLPEDEHFFFRREMHFAGKIGSIWQRLPYLLFGLFSEYGYSILRPTLWLLGIWALGFIAFWGYLSGCCVPAPDSVIERPMGSAMALSFSNLFPLFGFGRTFLKDFLQSCRRC